ncbi:unnamed protein product [Cuscuta campestris]|uniref:Uncharacterized protein n=1 Tax=Cuscuta campestris TaxID=132261 RepID=A0A484KNL3_9ASTE|nr:unnamed protein product [Cuscuta campestris]
MMWGDYLQSTNNLNYTQTHKRVFGKYFFLVKLTETVFYTFNLVPELFHYVSSFFFWIGVFYLISNQIFYLIHFPSD